MKYNKDITDVQTFHNIIGKISSYEQVFLFNHQL